MVRAPGRNLGVWGGKGVVLRGGYRDDLMRKGVGIVGFVGWGGAEGGKVIGGWGTVRVRVAVRQQNDSLSALGCLMLHNKL